MPDLTVAGAAARAPASAAAVCIHYVLSLGALALAQRQNLWLAGSREDRGGRAGKLKPKNAGGARNPRVFFLSFCWANAVRRPGPNEAPCDPKWSDGRCKIERTSMNMHYAQGISQDV